MDGIFIPKEILQMKGISMTEKVVLSIYKYYTEKGTNKCCSLNSVQIAKELNMSSRYLKTIKQHLKELGYIRTDGGIKVIYQGEQQLTPGNNSSPQQGTIAPPKSEQQLTPQGTIAHPPVNNSSLQQGTIAPPKSEQQLTHKEEKKEKNIKKEEKQLKEELSKEEKIARTNFKLIVDKIYPTLKTQEGLKFLWDTHKERLSSTDLTGGGLDSWVQGFQDILRKKFSIEQVTPKPKTKSDTIDMF